MLILMAAISFFCKSGDFYNFRRVYLDAIHFPNKQGQNINLEEFSVHTKISDQTNVV
jgi:Zn-dependent M16 (insulinase) family peptidase